MSGTSQLLNRIGGPHRNDGISTPQLFDQSEQQFGFLFNYLDQAVDSSDRATIFTDQILANLGRLHGLFPTMLPAANTRQPCRPAFRLTTPVSSLILPRPSRRERLLA